MYWYQASVDNKTVDVYASSLYIAAQLAKAVLDISNNQLLSIVPVANEAEIESADSIGW